MALPQKERYTYRDLLDWPENERFELYDGLPPGRPPHMQAFSGGRRFVYYTAQEGMEGLKRREAARQDREGFRNGKKSL